MRTQSLYVTLIFGLVIAFTQTGCKDDKNAEACSHSCGDIFVCIEEDPEGGLSPENELELCQSMCVVMDALIQSDIVPKNKRKSCWNYFLDTMECERSFTCDEAVSSHCTEIMQADDAYIASRCGDFFSMD